MNQYYDDWESQWHDFDEQFMHGDGRRWDGCLTASEQNA